MRFLARPVNILCTTSVDHGSSSQSPDKRSLFLLGKYISKWAWAFLIDSFREEVVFLHFYPAPTRIAIGRHIRFWKESYSIGALYLLQFRPATKDGSRLI